MAIYFKRLVILDVFLVTIFLLLSFIFLSRYLSRVSPNSRPKDLLLDERQDPSEEIVPLMLNPSPDRMLLEVVNIPRSSQPSPEEDQRVKDLLEVKHPPYCSSSTELRFKKQTVTLIADFNDYQFYDLKNTIGSLQVTNSWALIDEFLIVDDASALEYIKNDALKYFSAIPKVRLLRSTHIEPMGTARSRATAVRQVKSDIIVFIDSKTLVTRGWLQPLINLLSTQKSTLAVPHFDLIKDQITLTYNTTSNTVAVFSWNLAIRMRELYVKNSSYIRRKKSSSISKRLQEEYEDYKQGNKEEHYQGNQNVEEEEDESLRHTSRSPVLRGNVFAVRRDFFETIGGYDEALEEIGSAHLELSLRVWQCGGQILISACSRVGILDLNNPVTVTSHTDVMRIATLWFGEHQSAVYKASDIKLSERMTAEDNGLNREVEMRRKLIEARHQCRTIDWYLQTVAVTMIMPSRDAVRFGVLTVKTGRCSRLLRTMRIKLDECKPEHFNQQSPQMMFEMNRSGQLKVMGKCLTVKSNAYVLAEDCRTGDPHQQWRYTREQLINIWSKYCAMHVTDPDRATEGDRQIAMAQTCGSDSESSESFKIWEFITV